MAWDRERAIPDWRATVDSLKECLESVLMGIELGRQESVRDDVLALESLDELDGYLSALKRELGA